MKNLPCPYQNFECTELDTSGMTKMECSECQHYDKGIRPTGEINIDRGDQKAEINLVRIILIWIVVIIIALVIFN